MVNKIIVVGHLGGDPECATINEKTKAEFSIATSYTFKTAAGQREDQTDWHRVECWAGLADICKAYIKKGMQLYVEGRQRHAKYKNSEGVEKTRSYISASEIRILTPKNKSND